MMAIRETISVKCICGNKGQIKTTENDQPYSTPWIKYTLVGLKKGSSANDANNGLSLDINKLDLRCEACGKKIIL
jgi:hypothetical protein